jgi:TonB family protein
MALPSDTARTTFGLLPEFEARSLSFTASMAANFLAATTFVFVAMSGVHEHVQIPQYDNAAFVFPVPEPPIPQVTPKQIAQIKTPVVPAKIEAARRVTEQSVPAPRPELASSNLANAPIPSLPAAPPRAISPSRTPSIAAPKTVSTKPVFGTPLGVVPNPAANRSATVPAVGGFHQAVFEGQGTIAQPSGSAQTVAFSSGIAKGTVGSSGSGTAKSVEFGNGVAGPGGVGSPHGTVGGTNFNSTSPVATSVQLAGMPPQSSSFVSPIVTFEPHPRYTTEARQLNVQGEVIFEVRLTTTGKIEILRMVSGLGHGLDEEARDVVRHIQFQPAIKDGQPADQVTLVHVAFRLA